jgi:hypothetical protein
MTSITVYLIDGEWGAEEREYTDSENKRFTFRVEDGHLSVMEILRLIPDRSENWKKPRTIRVFPPGTWSEVSVHYGS